MRTRIVTPLSPYGEKKSEIPTEWGVIKKEKIKKMKRISKKTLPYRPGERRPGNVVK